jgi:hypothetical protein
MSRGSWVQSPVWPSFLFNNKLMELIWVCVTHNVWIEDGGAEDEAKQENMARLGLCEIISDGNNEEKWDISPDKHLWLVWACDVCWQVKRKARWALGAYLGTFDLWSSNGGWRSWGRGQTSNYGLHELVSEQWEWRWEARRAEEEARWVTMASLGLREVVSEWWGWWRSERVPDKHLWLIWAWWACVRF